MHNKQNLDTNMAIQALVNPVTPFAQNAPIIFCSETKITKKMRSPKET